MDTPRQISSHASSSMSSQSDHELEDEVCEDETHDDVPSRKTTAMEAIFYQLYRLKSMAVVFHGSNLMHMAWYIIVSSSQTSSSSS